MNGVECVSGAGDPTLHGLIFVFLNYFSACFSTHPRENYYIIPNTVMGREINGEMVLALIKIK
jgi:hypothetical protein